MPRKREKMGWIAIDRKIKDSCIWSLDPVNKFQAWMDILLRASHKDVTVGFNGRPYHLKRGQFITSVRKLSIEWNWSKNRTTNFLNMLEQEGMIERDSRTLTGTVITVVNYSLYQDISTPKRDSNKDSNEDTTKDSNEDTNGLQSTIYNNYKQDKQEEEPDGIHEWPEEDDVIEESKVAVWESEHGRKWMGYIDWGK